MSRKDDIIKAAVALFAENGYSETPTSQVAKKAGVAEGLIFHHFGNKVGILVHIFRELSEIYIQRIEKIMKKAETGLDALLKAIRFHFKFAESRSKEVRVLLRDFPPEFTAPDSEAGRVFFGQMTLIYDQIKNCIERGQKDGSIRNVPVEETAYIIRGVLTGVSRITIIMPVAPIRHDLYKEVEKFCRRSLSSKAPPETRR